MIGQNCHFPIRKIIVVNNDKLIPVSYVENKTIQCTTHFYVAAFKSWFLYPVYSFVQQQSRRLRIASSQAAVFCAVDFESQQTELARRNLQRRSTRPRESSLFLVTYIIVPSVPPAYVCVLFKLAQGGRTYRRRRYNAADDVVVYCE